MGQSARRNGVTRPGARSVSSAERRRLKQELQRQAGMTRLLAALSRAVTEAASSESAMTACLQLICKHGGWVVGRLGIFSDCLENPTVPERSYWQISAPGGYEEFTRASEDDRFYRPHGNFISAMLREKRPVWISPLWSVSGGRMAIALAQGLRCGFVFPVTLGDRIVAFLEFFATEVHPPDALMLENIIGVSAQLSRLIERERAELALRENQRLLTLVTQNLPAMIVYFDRDLVCRFANEAYCQGHKVTLDKVLGRTLLEITGEETYRVISSSLERTRSGQPAVLQHLKRIAGGELRYFHVHRVPDMSDDGEFRGYYAMLLDVTEQTLAEDALRQREQELRRALAEREELSRDLHDNTIQLIYSVGLGLEHVQQLIPEESEEAHRKLSDAVMYLNNAMQDLRGHIAVPSRTLVDAAQLRDELEGLTRMVHSTHGVQFRLTIDPAALLRTPPEAVSDMMGVVREAVSNSLRHSRADGGSISLQEHGDSVRLAVGDSGVGFEVERAEQTGQGLSNIRARAARLHAALEISSSPGMGTRISIDVPAARAKQGNKPNCQTDTDKL